MHFPQLLTALDADILSGVRYGLRTESAPLAGPRAPLRSLLGPAWVVGDNPIAKALHAALIEQGITSHLCPDSGAIVATQHHDSAEMPDEKPPHLFVTTACDEAALHDLTIAEHWQDRRETGVMAAYEACTGWLTMIRSTSGNCQVTIVGVVAFGSQFGFQGECAAAEGGARRLTQEHSPELSTHGCR